MNTKNITIPEGNNWHRLNIDNSTSVTVESTEEQGVKLAVTENTIAPSDSIRGHSLPVGVPMTVSDIGSGAVWVKSLLDEALITYTF